MRYDHKEKQREQIIDECARLGIVIAQRGQAVSLTGRGVSILVSDLANLDPRDLAPYEPQP